MGEVLSLLFWIGDDLSKAAVHLAQSHVRNGSLHRGGQQRMSETDAAALGDQHAGVLRLDDRRRYVGVPGKRGQRTAYGRDCRVRQRRGH